MKYYVIKVINLYKVMPHMFKNKFNSIPLISLLSFVLISFILLSDSPAMAQSGGQNKVYNLKINQTDWLKNSPGPSLKREDINNAGDPFGSDDGALDAPADAFKDNTIPQKPFNLNADQSGGGMGQPQQATPAMQSQQPVMPQQPRTLQAQDPESVGQMKLAWDMWHKRVAEAIYIKYNRLATVAFKRSRPLAAQVAYTVTRNGQITNVRLVQRSPNLIYNTMIFGVLKSMNGHPILAFPQGSRRMTVDKTGTFYCNYINNSGYKYTTGDTETIKNQR